jgi:hypothetical protein
MLVVLGMAAGAVASDEALWPGARSEGELRQQGFRPLSSETSLDGWDVQPGHVGHWVMKDGVIHYDGQAEGERPSDKCLWSQAEYGDFTLYLEWRQNMPPRMKPHPIVLWNGDFLLDEKGKRITRPHLDAGDSGIYVRGVVKGQINIWSQEQGSGELTGFRKDQSLPQSVRRAAIPLINADRPFGEWNAMLVTLQGNVITIQVNGETVIGQLALPGLPEGGPIALQHHGHDTIQFRNIWIREVK